MKINPVQYIKLLYTGSQAKSKNNYTSVIRLIDELVAVRAYDSSYEIN